MTSIVSYGGGVNSTAMLIGMIERKEPAPHAILFADTGGEKPHTYKYVEQFSAMLKLAGYPQITIVRKGGNGETLEQECLRKRSLPSVAYGFKTCSLKYKIEPQEKWCNNDPICRAIWAEGGAITRCIGFHVDEAQRVRDSNDKKYVNRFPLIEWGWDQEDCKSAILSAGLELPGKSACFFCPNSRPSEVRELAKTYHDLAERALAMEANAELSAIVGLGRHFSWRDLLNQVEMFPAMYEREMPCGCYDGEAA